MSGPVHFAPTACRAPAALQPKEINMTAATTPPVTVQVTEYTVSAIPETNINNGYYAITVAYRGRGLWAVTRMSHCLGSDGSWDWESIPSEREDEWLATHSFDHDTALRLAVEAAPKVTVNGRTVADVLARH